MHHPGGICKNPLDRLRRGVGDRPQQDTAIEYQKKLAGRRRKRRSVDTDRGICMFDARANTGEPKCVLRPLTEYVERKLWNLCLLFTSAELRGDMPDAIRGHLDRTGR